MDVGMLLRTEGDELHAAMIRSFRDTATDDPYPLKKEYLHRLKLYSAADVAEDSMWARAPVAVVGNHERNVLTSQRAETYAAATGGVALKWRHELAPSAGGGDGRKT